MPYKLNQNKTIYLLDINELNYYKYYKLYHNILLLHMQEIVLHEQVLIMDSIII